MKRIAATLLLLTLTTQIAHAAPLQLRLPTPEVRRERFVAIGLGIAGAVLLAVGAPLAVRASGSQPGYAGIGLATIGGASAMASLYTLTHAAGHAAVLRAVDRDGSAALDRLDTRARRTEISGIVTTAVGLTFFALGLFLTTYSLRDASIGCEGDACNRPGHPDAAAEWGLGLTFSALGDAAWLAGSFVWSYGSGMRGGVKEARGTVHASLSGLSGTF